MLTGCQLLGPLSSFRFLSLFSVSAPVIVCVRTSQSSQNLIIFYFLVRVQSKKDKKNKELKDPDIGNKKIWILWDTACTLIFLLIQGPYSSRDKIKGTYWALINKENWALTLCGKLWDELMSGSRLATGRWPPQSGRSSSSPHNFPKVLIAGRSPRSGPLRGNGQHTHSVNNERSDDFVVLLTDKRI